MPVSPRIKFAAGVGAGAVIAGAGVWAWTAYRRRPKPRRKGSLLCPGHVGRSAAPSGSVGRGDFVVVQLQSPDGAFSESTWAEILSQGEGTFVAVLTGEQIPAGVRPLDTKRHGFRLGQKLLLDEDCIWDVFVPAEFEGQILCGPKIEELGDQDLFPVAGALTVGPDDLAEIIVGSQESRGDLWNERIWTRIVTTSPSGQVITARVEDDLELGDQHGLGRGSILRYNRDCIIGV